MRISYMLVVFGRSRQNGMRLCYSIGSYLADLVQDNLQFNVLVQIILQIGRQAGAGTEKSF